LTVAALVKETAGFFEAGVCHFSTLQHLALKETITAGRKVCIFKGTKIFDYVKTDILIYGAVKISASPSQGTHFFSIRKTNRFMLFE
jgi:hypothetical protein